MTYSNEDISPVKSVTTVQVETHEEPAAGKGMLITFELESDAQLDDILDRYTCVYICSYLRSVIIH